jgi:hypothetical protein
VLAAFAAAVALAPIRFPPRPGWRAGSTAVHACPGVAPQRCRFAPSWAATVPHLDCANCLPHRTVERLPPDGIVIHVSIGLEQPRRLQGLPWPPKIDPAAIAAPFEGLPGRIGVFQASNRAGPFDVGVMIFFGRPHPTRAQVARAQAELSAARLP